MFSKANLKAFIDLINRKYLVLTTNNRADWPKTPLLVFYTLDCTGDGGFHNSAVRAKGGEGPVQWRWYFVQYHTEHSLPANQLITLLWFSHWVTSSQCQGWGGQVGLANKVLLDDLSSLFCGSPFEWVKECIQKNQP